MHPLRTLRDVGEVVINELLGEQTLPLKQRP